MRLIPSLILHKYTFATKVWLVFLNFVIFPLRLRTNYSYNVSTTYFKKIVTQKADSDGVAVLVAVVVGNRPGTFVHSAWLRPIIFCLSLITHALPTSAAYRQSALRPKIQSFSNQFPIRNSWNITTVKTNRVNSLPHSLPNTFPLSSKYEIFIMFVILISLEVSQFELNEFLVVSFCWEHAILPLCICRLAPTCSATGWLARGSCVSYSREHFDNINLSASRANKMTSQFLVRTHGGLWWN